MKFKDLFGPYAAYVKKNEPLACPKRRPRSLGGHRAIGGGRSPATLRVGWGGEEGAGRGRCGWLRVQGAVGVQPRPPRIPSRAVRPRARPRGGATG